MATPDELFAGVALGTREWWSGAAAAIASALSAGLLGARLRRGRQSGGFAVLAATVVAVGPPLLAMAMVQPPTIVFGVAGAGVVVAVVALPWLRDRGVASLAIVAVVAAAMPALALRCARVDAHAATTLRVFDATLAALPTDLDAIGILLGADVDPRTVAALPLAARGRTLFAVAEDGLEAPWLLRMGMPVLRLHAASCTPARAGRGPQLGQGARAILPSFVRGGDGVVTGVAVKCERARAGELAVLFTPCGAITGVVADDGNAAFDDKARAMLRGWLAPLPTAPTIRVLVVPPDSADGYGWTDLRP